MEEIFFLFKSIYNVSISFFLLQKITIFLVEQYFDFAFNLSDYFYVMQRGKIIIEGDKEKLGKKLLKSQLSF